MSTLGKYNISSYIDDLIPEHVQSLYPDLVSFLKVYALYLERQNKSGFYLNSIDIQRDIDHVEATLLTELQNEIGIAVPRDFATDPRMFYKRLVEFYRSRGTPESITSFFRIIFDDDVETYFPFVDLLNPSDGDWIDQSADVKINQSAYTAWNTFTISTTAAGSFTVGLKYKITTLTGTSQAQWNTAAGTSGVTYAIGSTFTAAAVGAGSGTASSNLVSGNNDDGNAALFDSDVVFVNNVYQTPITDYNEEIYSAATTIKYKLTFTNPLTNGDVVKTYPKGIFTTSNGFLSDLGTYQTKYLQDSYYWQQFSYVLKTGSNVAKWKNSFTRLVHPAGFIFFGEILIFIWDKDENKLLNNAQYGWLPPAGAHTLNLAAKQIGPITFNRIGKYSTVLVGDLPPAGLKGTIISSTDGYSLIEKTYSMFPTGSGGDTNGPWDIGMWDHWENMKFKYLGPISNFASYTIQDSINNNIGIQHNQEVMKLTCGTLATINGEPYTSTYTRPYIVNGVNQNSDITYYEQNCTSTYG